MDTYHAGQVCPESGIYEDAAGERQVALSKGDRFPPTDRGGSWHVIRLTQDPDADTGPDS